MLSDFLNLERLTGMRPKNIHELGLQRNDFTGSLLTSFDTWLMIGIDPNHRGIEADGSLIQGNEEPNCSGGDFGDSQGDRFTLIFMQGSACPKEETLEKIPAGDAGFDFHRSRFSIFEHLDEGGKEIVSSISKLLYISVLICRSLVAVDDQTLLDASAIQIIRLAQ